MKKTVLLLASIFLLSSCHSDLFSKKISKLKDRELDEYCSNLGEHYFYSLSEKLKRARQTKDCPKVQSLAKELLSVAQFYSSNWNYGNAIFEGNLAFAECDVKEKKIDSALLRLKEAAKTPGSPQLNSFGPPYSDLSVLSELLREGKKKEVLDFLGSFNKYWELEFSKEIMTFWTSEIAANRIPKFEIHEGQNQKATENKTDKK